MTAFYNEIDPHAAQWLRNLIAAGHIPHGVVDERSIADIAPEELHGYTQCHFFAGVGVWPYALRRAGWPDDRPVWTGSCPCQPFSAAGAGAGFDDERHLWPAFFHHIEQCEPPVVFGEQVASKPVDDWIDLVQADLEAVGYAVGAVPFPSAGIGAPHIRDRLFWVADGRMEDAGRKRRDRLAIRLRSRGPQQGGSEAAGGGSAGWLEHPESDRGYGPVRGHEREEVSETLGRSGPRGVGDAERDGLRSSGRPPADLADQSGDGPLHTGALATAGPVNGLWRDADWLLCRDGRWRPVEPGTFPLATGAASRVGRLRAYGNAINAEAAVAFIEAYEEARRQRPALSAARELVEDLV